MKNIIYCAIISLAISFGLTAYSDLISADLHNSLVRLHVVANSNSDADQTVKLKVRDAVLSELYLTTPDESAKSAQEIAARVLKENGFNYEAVSQFTTAYFPKKEYGGFTLPQGNYRAVRVILGEGRGENWWCILYPPVCMEDARSDGEKAREELSENLKAETYDVITGKAQIRFRVVDLIGSLM
jgi:stage II sporulation protein R